MQIKKIIIAAAFWLFIWQAAAFFVGFEILLPSPLSVLMRLTELVQTWEFWQTTGWSMFRVFLSFTFGTLIGICFAICICVFPVADYLLSPIVSVIRATPVASFIILTLLWLDHSTAPIFISTLMVIPILCGNIHAGITSTDKNLLEMAHCFSFGKIKTVRLVYIPSVLPYFYSACITALGMAWKSSVAAEVLCTPKNAVGTKLYFSKIYLETPSLFAWTIAVIVMSYILEFGFTLIFKKQRSLLKGVKL